MKTKKMKTKISSVLTKIILLLSVVIGIIFSVMQIYFDVASQKENDVKSIEQLVETIMPLASQAAYEMNEQAAKEVLTGVMAFGPVLSASIVDEKGRVLSNARRNGGEIEKNIIYEYIYSDMTSKFIVLRSPYYEGAVGHLTILFDSKKLGDGILFRSLNILIFGIFRNVVLAFISLFIFNWYIGSPLVRVSQDFADITFEQHDAVQLEIPPHHDRDELGTLIRNINKGLAERGAIEEQLRHAQKMEAVGQLAGGIAHDFNNILGIIKGNLELLSDVVGTNEPALRRIEIADRAAGRGVELIRKLLSFARTQPANAESVSVNRVVEDVIEFLPRAMTASIRVEVKLAEDLRPVRVSRGELQDAIVNLALNARDAMPDGGALSIETENKILDNDYVSHNPTAETGAFVLLTLSDTGTGIPADILDGIVEPFFTTKSESRGTGLGLTMVSGFVQRSGGHMKIYSEEGMGTTFRIYLPYAEAGDAVSSDLIVSNDMPYGHETVLVVDDEPDLVDLAVANLRSLGYRTMSAGDGAEAWEIFKNYPDIDLVFSDIVMPGAIDGYDLATRCLAEKPDIKILLTSGFTQNRERLAYLSDDVHQRLSGNLLAKPYLKAELAFAIRKAFDIGT